MPVTNNIVRIICATALSATVSISTAGMLRAESHKEMTGVVSKVIVKATPKEVFDAIRTYRKAEPLKRKVLEEQKNCTTIKETFPSVPVLGDVECTYKETEEPYSRIDFQLLSSNKLKIFEGNWQISPVGDGKTTLVKLTSFLDSEANVPGKDFLQHLQTHQDIHRRLNYVKRIAEGEEREEEAKNGKGSG